MTDIRLAHEGNLIGFQPVSPRCKQWMHDHVRSAAWQWLGPTLWVDHRIAEVLALALVTEGFNLGELS